jgi:hypothetical protein
MINIENCIQKPAKGTEGVLIRTFTKYVFRVYKVDHTFIDYDIEHCDLDVTINSDDATFYEFKDGTASLDHSYEVYHGNIEAGIDRNTDIIYEYKAGPIETVVVNEYDVGTEEGFNAFIKSRNNI